MIMHKNMCKHQWWDSTSSPNAGGGRCFGHEVVNLATTLGRWRRQGNGFGLFTFPGKPAGHQRQDLDKG